MAGDGGLGKSSILMDITARITWVPSGPIGAVGAAVGRRRLCVGRGFKGVNDHAPTPGDGCESIPGQTCDGTFDRQEGWAAGRKPDGPPGAVLLARATETHS